MKTVEEILEHITKVCVRNKDGSLNLGTYEVKLLEKALRLEKKYWKVIDEFLKKMLY